MYKAEGFKWSADSDGEWLCIKLRNAMSILNSIDPTKPYDLEIKQHRERRSLDANAYCWVLLDKLAEKTGIRKTEIYKDLIRNIGGNCTVVCVQDVAVYDLRMGWEKNGIGWQTEEIPSKIDGCTNVVLYYGSSTYDTKQMSRLIDLVVQECKEQEIETMTPQELSRLMETWHGR